MKTYLVTGAAGFIGANYIKYILGKHDDVKIVILDALTYAGNLETISQDIDNERCFFVKGNICDRNLADQLFADYKFDYIVNFAAESQCPRGSRLKELRAWSLEYRSNLSCQFRRLHFQQRMAIHKQIALDFSGIKVRNQTIE